MLTATLSQPFSNTHSISLFSPRVLLDPDTSLCVLITAHIQDTFDVYIDSYPVSPRHDAVSSRLPLLHVTDSATAGYGQLSIDINQVSPVLSVVRLELVATVTSGVSMLSSIASIEVKPTTCAEMSKSYKY